MRLDVELATALMEVKLACLSTTYECSLENLNTQLHKGASCYHTFIACVRTTEDIYFNNYLHYYQFLTENPDLVPPDELIRNFPVICTLETFVLLTHQLFPPRRDLRLGGS